MELSKESVMDEVMGNAFILTRLKITFKLQFPVVPVVIVRKDLSIVVTYNIPLSDFFYIQIHFVIII